MRISDWSSDVCSSDLGGASSEEPGSGVAERIRSQPVRRRASVNWNVTISAVPLSALPDAITGRTSTSGKSTKASDVWPSRCQGASQRLPVRSEEHTSELQSLMRISYAVFCLKKKTNNTES